MPRTRASAGGGGQLTYLNCLKGSIFTSDTNYTIGAADINWLSLLPFQAYRTITVSGMALAILGGAPAGNVRMGIYRDNGDQPDGGVLLGETGVGAPAAVGKFELALNAPVQLQQGLYWMAVLFSAVGLQCQAHSQREGRGGTLYARMVAHGFGALPNPCPVTAVWTVNETFTYLLVTSVP